MDYMEISAKTVDDAITKASIELGLSSDQLEYEVISQGSTGFLGIGSKPAVIQVRRKVSEEDVMPEQQEEIPAAAADDAEHTEVKEKKKKREKAAAPKEAKEAKSGREQEEK